MMQRPTGVSISSVTIRVVKIEVMTPLHLPNYCSIKLDNGSSIPEFSANSLAKVVRPCKALVIGPSGAMLLGMKVQHWHPTITHSPPSSARIMSESESETHSIVSDSLQPHGLYSPWNSLGQNTRVGSLSLLQGIFPTQGSNPGLLHCRRILYQLSRKGRPESCLRPVNFPHAILLVASNCFAIPLRASLV